MKTNKTSFSQEAIKISFIISITIAFLTSSFESREWIINIRLLAIAIVMVGMLHLFFTKKITIFSTYFIIAIFIFFIWGSFLSITKENLNIFLTIGIDGLIIIAGGFLLSIFRENFFSTRTSKIIIYYMAAGLLLLLLTNGIALDDYTLKFNLEYFNTETKEESYSQGISQFFGIGAIFAAFYYTNINSSKILGYTIILSLLLLSLLGGARGDSVFSLLVVALILLTNKKWRLILTISFILAFFIFSYFIKINLEHFTIYNRLSESTELFLGRDALLTQGIDLLFNQPSCLFFGCGFGYFQYYYDYSYGSFPHNFILELIIVFGLPLTIAMLALTVIGIKNHLKNSKTPNALIHIYIYTLLIGMKSNPLTGNWLLLIISIYFITLATNKDISLN